MGLVRRVCWVDVREDWKGIRLWVVDLESGGEINGSFWEKSEKNTNSSNNLSPIELSLGFFL